MTVVATPLHHRDDKWTGLAPWEFEFPFPGSLYLPSSFPLVTWKMKMQVMTVVATSMASAIRKLYSVFVWEMTFIRV